MKIKNPRRYAGARRKDYSYVKPEPQSEPVIQSAILFRTCEKLPLDIFIDCLVDGDFSGLGSGPELGKVWEAIYIQSVELSQDGSYNEIFEIRKKINDLRAKITEVNSIINYLQMKFDQDLIDILNGFALRCDIKESDTGPTLVNKLNVVIARMKKWFPELSMKEKELEKALKENVGKAADRAFFDDWLEVMSEAKGYQVEAAKITVSRFYRSIATINKKAQSEQLKATKKHAY